MEHSNRSIHRWSLGDHVILRHVHAGKVWAAIPVTVVEDNPQRIALYVCPDTEFAAPLCSRDEHLRILSSGHWTLQLLSWFGHHLWTTTPGASYSIWTLWSGSNWKHQMWKINPEEPLQRTSIGFDTRDHEIDVVIQSDLSRWDWKDEDEFAEAVQLGLITSEDANQIRQKTIQVANEIISQQADQLRAFANWRPPSTWTTPVLAGNWRTL